jgi:serine/threonine-protein kinase HipA
VPNATIFLNNGQNAYITRRIELSQSNIYINKYPLQELVDTEDRAIDSVEDLAGLLKKYIAAYKPQVEHLFALSVFNYLFSNNAPAHYQLSIIETAEGEYILSPAYNLFCTELHENKKTSTLYNGDYASVTFVRNGFYSYHDFYTLALKIGIVAKRAERILKRFMENELATNYLISYAFLNEESKQTYAELYRTRLRQLKTL